MIGRLRGKVLERDEESLVLDVNGVGYHVFCSTRTLAALPGEGEMAELTIETHVREDHIHLYGFPSKYERDWFRLLTTVQGVGVKMGLAILGAYSPEQLAHAIAAQDKASLTRISGVGPKLAERMVTELKSKVAKFATSTVIPLSKFGKKTAAATPASLTEDAVSALVHLGYNRMDAFSAIASAQHKQGGKTSIDELIKGGLKELAR